MNSKVQVLSKITPSAETPNRDNHAGVSACSAKFDELFWQTPVAQADVRNALQPCLTGLR